MDATLSLPRLDEERYLVEPAEWSESLAEYFAQQENITLTDADCDVIRFNKEHQIAPDARHVIKHLSARLGADARNTLFNMFVYGYIKRACKIAGTKRSCAWSTG